MLWKQIKYVERDLSHMSDKHVACFMRELYNIQKAFLNVGGKKMWDRKLLKKNGKQAFLRNYWACVAACTLVMVLLNTIVSFVLKIRSNDAETDWNAIRQYINDYVANGTANPEVFLAEIQQLMFEYMQKYLALIIIVFLIELVVMFAVRTIVSNVFAVGLNRYFLENREHKTGIGKIFYGFREGRYASTVWVMFLQSVYIFVWSLFFVIPGIIKSYSYKLVPYIMAENSNIDCGRVFELSKKMMKGHKWEAFKLELSFIGWELLACEPTGLLYYFFVIPYEKATYTEFYCALKAEAKAKGILMPNELPDRLIKEVEDEGRVV